uniref:DNA-directed RNA polymerase sigma-70 factor n=1 Tax=Thermosporothrix sp. COM3 TaxID=2490863 RepID=A0A455SHI3_9CHLR|nr:hypothetical protein KTC_26840 [Thermosporothrix sp. COM3]
MRPYQFSQERITGQDTSLPAVLYQLYAARLLSYLRRHLPDISDAEDVLLEIFVAVLEHEQTLAERTEDEQRAWLWTVARNKVKDVRKRLARRPLLVMLEQASEMPEDEGEMPEAVTLREEAHRSLHLNIQKLSSVQQELLELRFGYGLNHMEIAATLHKREGTIRTMLSRTLDKLRTFYARNEGENSHGRKRK